MSRISIAIGNRLTPVDDHIAASVTVDLNGTNTLSVTLGAPYAALVSDETRILFDGQFYYITDYTHDTDGEAPIVTINAEHCSYELNDPEYDVQAFALLGTPRELLTAALSNTPYSVGTVEPTDEKTLILSEPTTCRALIQTIATLCGGELTFSGAGRTVNLLSHRGAVEPVEIMGTDSVDHVTYMRNKLDDTHSYDLTLIQKSTLQLGDNIHLEYTPLGIDTETRIIGMTFDPFDPFNVSITVGDFVPDIVSVMVQDSQTVDKIIQTFSVSDGKFISKIEVEQFISSLEQTAEKITWLIQSGTGISSFVLTPEMLELVSQNITIKGFVTFANLEETGMTSISGSTIRTNHVDGQSGATGIELDAPTSAGSTITATVTWSRTVDTNVITVTLSEEMTEPRDFDVTIVYSNGYRFSHPVTVLSGRTSGRFEERDSRTPVVVFFGLSGQTTLVFSDGSDVPGVSCTGDFAPSVNSTYSTIGYSLGTTQHKWKEAHIYSGVIEGSARIYKKDIKDLNDKHSLLFDGLRPRSYKFANGESDRTHYGLIVDEVRDALDAAGLTPEECAAYVLDDPDVPDGGGGVRYAELIALLIREIQKIKEKIK